MEGPSVGGLPALPLTAMEPSDHELETELRRRASMRGARLVVERTPDGLEWKATFETPSAASGNDLSFQSPSRHVALKHLAGLDDLRRGLGM